MGRKTNTEARRTQSYTEEEILVEKGIGQEQNQQELNLPLLISEEGVRGWFE